jgi:hypothetical protein
MEIRALLRSLFSPWVILGSIVVAGVLFGATFLLVWFTRPASSAQIPATPIMVVIPAPSATPPAATAAPTVDSTGTPPVPPAPAAGTLEKGAYVQISGTGGDGVRVRAEPGLQNNTLFVALESEVFQIDDGPRQADGYTWWHLLAPFDATHNGWAVSNYLSVVQKP